MLLKQSFSENDNLDSELAQTSLIHYNTDFENAYSKINEQTIEIQSFLNSCEQKNILETLISEKYTKQDSSCDTSAIYNDEDFKISENTLIISEKNGYVTLPYTLAALTECLSNNPTKYSSIKEIIEKEYTKPLKFYKNSSISRFKETFKLVHDRSHGSFKHSLDLALEAFFNYNLHPAIISACKTIDELDIYLSCLEYDELEDFKFFKIIFDAVPTLSKKRKFAY